MKCRYCSTELAHNDWIAVCATCNNFGCRHCITLLVMKIGFAAYSHHSSHSWVYDAANPPEIIAKPGQIGAIPWSI